MIETETLIVGAGPGGATAARHLALAGRETLLIDRAEFPRPKPCGGGVPLHTCALFDFDISPVIEASVTTVSLVGAWTGRQDNPVVDGCKIVDRTRFDTFLVKRAQEAGAKLSENCRLKNITKNGTGFVAQTSRGEIHARRVIAADGAYSPTGRALGFPRNDSLGIALEAIVPLDTGHDAATRTTALFHFTCLRGGYGWIFPRGEVLNIGIGSADRRQGPALRKHLLRFMANLPELKGREWTEICGGQLPNFSGARDRYAVDGAYLIGDAAGFVDPLTGEGIYYAVASGRAAAEAIMGDGEAQYEDALAADIIPELQLARRYARWFHLLPLWTFGGVMCTGRYRRYVEYFIRILSGSCTYREMYRQMHPGKDLPKSPR